VIAGLIQTGLTIKMLFPMQREKTSKMTLLTGSECFDVPRGQLCLFVAEVT
jgi:hypothetical protein